MGYTELITVIQKVYAAPFITGMTVRVTRGIEMSADEIVTQAAQLITGGDFAGAMGVFESYIDSNSDDPAGYHGWAEAALFDIQENGNLDDKGMIGLTRGQINAYFRRAASKYGSG